MINNGQLLSNARERHAFAKQCLETAQNLKERLTEVRFPDSAPNHAEVDRGDALQKASEVVMFLESWVEKEAERLS